MHLFKQCTRTCLTILNVSTVSTVNYLFTASSGTSFTSALSCIKYMYIHEQLYNKILLHVPAVSRALVKKQNIFYKMILCLGLFLSCNQATSSLKIAFYKLITSQLHSMPLYSWPAETLLARPVTVCSLQLTLCHSVHQS